MPFLGRHCSASARIGQKYLMVFPSTIIIPEVALCFNRHIGDRHSSCHIYFIDDVAAKFEYSIGRALDANLADQRQYEVFRKTFAGNSPIKFSREWPWGGQVQSPVMIPFSSPVVPTPAVNAQSAVRAGMTISIIPIWPG